MSVINPRNRLVNFRLSEVEFDQLRVACQELGARSISEFARPSALEKMSQAKSAGGPGTEASPTRVEMLDQKVAELETRVSQLLSLVAATGTSVVPETVESEIEATARVGF
ncbi:MAG: hypothetical protein FJW31_29035 [Acidobacteria bacterium]|nr:hypothetical protein [Acidobacteriota bacterium]